MTSAAGLLGELVRTPSESGAEEAVADRLEAELKALGLGPVRVGRSLYAVLGRGGKLLLLNSHLDTVPPGEGWTRPPLGAVVEAGRLYGRGSNDAKGSVAAMLLGAARAYASAPPPGRVCLAFGCEEETSNRGIADLLARVPQPDAAVVGEPTGLQPAVAQKGLLLLTVTAKGRSAHAAWGGGVNAVHAAAKDILALASVSFDREHPVLGRPSLEVTQVEGGRRHNVIPDRCTLVVDIRTTPAYAPDELVAMVRATVRGEVEVRSRRLESVDTPVGHPIVRAALAANPGATPFGSPTVSDWAYLKGNPAVKAGPGDSRRSHAPDEYLELAELEAGVLFYERLIRAYHEPEAP
ncbi:MAG: M20/M25/M40 family metallo-hydrolase [Elusimicrobia bacterium]|nr:M20/M25/M40 family metallo-hydrolase [Elusimicrobiota bacterium]